MIPLTAFLIGPIGVYAGAGLASALSAGKHFSPFIFAILIRCCTRSWCRWSALADQRDHAAEHPEPGLDFIQGPMGSWNFACFAPPPVCSSAWRDKDMQMRRRDRRARCRPAPAVSPSRPSTASTCATSGSTPGCGRLFRRRSDHRPVRRREGQRLRFHLAADHPVVQPDAGLPAVDRRGLLHRDDPGHHLRLPHPGAKAEILAARQQAEADLALEATAPVAAGAVATDVATSTIGAPVAGTVVALTEVNDKVFASKALGEGVGILPTNGTHHRTGFRCIVTARPKPDTPSASRRRRR